MPATRPCNSRTDQPRGCLPLALMFLLVIVALTLNWLWGPAP